MKNHQTIIDLMVRFGLLVAGVIHLLPLAGILGADQLKNLYGVAVPDPNLQILMRHRALLFALLGVLLLLAIVKQQYRAIAIAAGLLSVSSFMLLLWPSRDVVATELLSVFYVDALALILLLLSLVAEVVRHRRLGGAQRYPTN